MGIQPDIARGPGSAPGPERQGRGWVAVWHDGTALIRPAPHDIQRPQAEITLCLEMKLHGVPKRTPVRLWQGDAEPNRAIGLYAMPDGAMRLVHGETDLATPPGFARSGETVTLKYRSCARGRRDKVIFDNVDRPLQIIMRAGVASASRIAEALPRDPRFLEMCSVAAVADFGVPSSDLPAVAAGTLIQTRFGPMPVEQLTPGVEVVTFSGARRALRWVEGRPHLCLGRTAPIRLRAPYFGLARDMCVTPGTSVLRFGAAVEYIFGVEQVLVRAEDMVSGRGAVRDRSLPVRWVYHMMLDDHDCIAVDRCAVETALLADVVGAEHGAQGANLEPKDRTPCLPVLDRASAQALLTASARGQRRMI